MQINKKSYDNNSISIYIDRVVAFFMIEYFSNQMILNSSIDCRFSKSGLLFGKKWPTP